MTKSITITNYFCSFYHPVKATYLSPVNVQKSLDNHPCPSEGIAEVAQRVKNSKNGEKVELADMTRGQWFVVPLHSVDPLTHVIRSEGETCRGTPADLFLRLAMVDRMEAIAKVFPGVRISEHYGAARDCLVTPYTPYNLKSADESRQWIAGKKAEEQVALARKLCEWIKAVGFAQATFDTIRIDEKGEFIVLEATPYGLLVEEGDEAHPRMHSIEKCARVGLFNLLQDASGADLKPFADEVKKHYDKSLPDYSWTRIILSILCPLIPLVFLIISVYKTYQINALAASSNLDKYYAEIENVLLV